MNITSDELKRRLEIARRMPGAAHMPLFGLVCRPGEGPVCEVCGGTAAPIIGGKHPDGWCYRDQSGRLYRKEKTI